MRGRSLLVGGVGLAAVLGMLGVRSGAEFSPGQVPVTLPRRQPADGGTQVYLKLVPATSAPAVQGEVADKQHAGEIAIHSYTLGMKNPTTIGSATGGAGAGKAQFEPLELVHTVDRASPALFKIMATGAHFKEATLTVVFNGVEFQRIRMGTAFITNITQTGGGPLSAPTETIRMAYGQLLQEYRGGTGKETGSAGWNQITNKDMPEFPK